MRAISFRSTIYLACGLAGLALVQPAVSTALAQEMGPPDGAPPGAFHGGQGGPGSPRGFGGPGAPGGPGGPDGPGGMHEGGPLGSLAKAEADKAATEAIADVSKAQAEDVARIVRTWDVPTALRYFNVKPLAFHEAVQPRLIALVKAAETNQQITPEAAQHILAEMQQRPPHPPE